MRQHIDESVHALLIVYSCYRNHWKNIVKWQYHRHVYIVTLISYLHHWHY